MSTPTTILTVTEALLALGALVERIAKARGFEPAELEEYIEKREAVRAALVDEARGLASDPTPAVVSESSTPSTPPPSTPSSSPPANGEDTESSDESTPDAS